MLFLDDALDFIPEGVYYENMSTIGEYIKQKRKEIGLTQDKYKGSYTCIRLGNVKGFWENCF